MPFVCLMSVLTDVLHLLQLMECCDLLKALAVVVIVYSLKFQKSLEALKWDQGLVYKSSIKMLCGYLFQRIFPSSEDVFLLGQLVFL